MFTHPELDIMISKLDTAVHTNSALIDEGVYEGAEAALSITQNEIMASIIERLKDMRLNTVSMDADQMGHLYSQLQDYLKELNAKHAGPNAWDERNDGWNELKDYVDKVVLATSLMSKLAQGVLSEDDLQKIGMLLKESVVADED